MCLCVFPVFRIPTGALPVDDASNLPSVRIREDVARVEISMGEDSFMALVVRNLRLLLRYGAESASQVAMKISHTRELWEYTKAHFVVRYSTRWLVDVVDQLFSNYREELWVENMLSDLVAPF